MNFIQIFRESNDAWTISARPEPVAKLIPRLLDSSQYVCVCECESVFFYSTLLLTTQ